MKCRKVYACLLAALMGVTSLGGVGMEMNVQASEDGEQSTDAQISGELNIAVFQGGYGADYWYDVVEMF